MSLLGRFFNKKGAAGPPPTARAAAPIATAVPAYYEVWGSLERANRALWVGLWLATTTAVLCLILVRLLITRPPIVIRVSDAGMAQVVADPGRQPPVSEAEIKNFLSLFERFFFGLNAYTYEADLNAAFPMMTAGFQPKANDMLKRQGTIDGLKANQGRVTVTLTELKVLRDTSDIVECRVMGNRQVGSFKLDGGSGRVVFEHDIILRKVPRSDKAPYGVLVDDLHESVYENTLKN